MEAESRQRTFDGAMTAPASTLWKDLFLALLEAAHRAIPWQVARTAHVARGQVVIVAESAARGDDDVSALYALAIART